MSTVPKTALNALEPETLLMDVLNAPGHGHALAAMVAYRGIQNALVAAKRQQRRIRRDKRQWTAWVSGRRRADRTALFDDVHFYVISWTRAAKLARFLRAKTRFRQVGLVVRRYQRECDEMTRYRDHLEHFEDRLDRKFPKPPKQPGDLFNMVGDQMSFGGERVDVGPKSTAVLKAFVKELQSALVFDSLDTLYRLDKQLFIRRLQSAHRDLEARRLMRELESRHPGQRPGSN